jgi:hypothetical protein
MESFYYRYNSFTDSYLIKYNENEFEVDSELFYIIKTYHNNPDYDKTIVELKEIGLVISRDELSNILIMLQSESTFESNIRSRTFKLINFQKLEFLLRHRTIVWSFFLIAFIFSFLTIDNFLFYFSLPKTNFFSMIKYF